MREITMHTFPNTGPVINWLKLPDSGEKLLTLASAINTPAVAAAFCIQQYTAKANDEISLQVNEYKLKMRYAFKLSMLFVNKHLKKNYIYYSF